MIKETVQVVKDKPIQVTNGTAGIKSQLPGSSVTVSGVAAATGGIGKGNLIERYSK